MGQQQYFIPGQVESNQGEVASVALWRCTASYDLAGMHHFSRFCQEAYKVQRAHAAADFRLMFGVENIDMLPRVSAQVFFSCADSVSTVTVNIVSQHLLG